MAFDLDSFLALDRVGAIALSPDGSRLVGTVGRVAPDSKKMRSAIWEFDTDEAGASDARQLTRSAAGEGAPMFAPNGDVLFVSARPDPDAVDASEPTAGLWRLPADGGEAELVMSAPGGVSGAAVARESGRLLVCIALHPSARDLDHDADIEKARTDAGVTAQLFEQLPIRYWDHYIGPRQPRLFVADPTPDGYGPLRQVARDFAHDFEPSYDITPDGSEVIVTVGSRRADRIDAKLVAIDVASKKRRVIAEQRGWRFDEPTVSPDGRTVVAVAGEIPTPDEPGDQTLVAIDLASSERRDLLPGFDRFPTAPVWSPDSSRLFFTADQMGHRPVFSVMAGSGRVTQLTESASFQSLAPHPDGDALYALRSAVYRPPQPVRLTAKRVSEPVTIAAPGQIDTLPGRLREVRTTADDGVELRSWLAVPARASGQHPAPMVVWVHGGPMGSWNDWSWRWNPWLLVERGYAVLLPDPAISTGYGLDFIRRGHRDWGNAPYTDVMALTDAAEQLAAIDADATSLMGGSFGGYMANWVAGHTDRFRCIVTHASLWGLDNFSGTTDLPAFWQAMWGSPYVDDAEVWREHSPHRFVDRITTPMLVIHGELDHRVPIGEGLRLWSDLQLNGVESRFLYFPDENHWVLKPQNARLWYETVFAFLDEYVHGTRFERPELL